MSNDVFVNGREVACKAGDGKSSAAFPDVCFTPPKTSGSPQGIPVPYANTAYAKDTTNGSKTVMITGKEVVLKDKSYFKTSSGNEAGKADKGTITGQISGKAYFTSWSMDVFIEGHNVCRHMDLMTHNHGSWPPNTGVWKFLDEETKGKCKKEIKKVEQKCSLSKKEKEKIKEDNKKKKFKSSAPPTWKDKHCKGLGIKSMSDLSPEEVKTKLEELTDVSKRAEEAMGEVKNILVEKAKEYAAKKGAQVVAKSALKGWLGPVGWAWTAYDVVSTGFDLKEQWDNIDELKNDLKSNKRASN